MWIVGLSTYELAFGVNGVGFRVEGLRAVLRLLEGLGIEAESSGIRV